MEIQVGEALFQLARYMYTKCITYISGKTSIAGWNIPSIGNTFIASGLWHLAKKGPRAGLVQISTGGVPLEVGVRLGGRKPIFFVGKIRVCPENWLKTPFFFGGRVGKQMFFFWGGENANFFLGVGRMLKEM